MVRIQFQQLLKTVLLAAFALFFIKLHVSGDLFKYVNPKYEMMSYIAIWIFMLLFFVQLFRIWEGKREQHAHCSPGCTHDHGSSISLPKKWLNYSIILFPLVTGFTLPPAVLDSSIAANKGALLPRANSSIIYDEAGAAINNNFISKEEYNNKMKLFENSAVIALEDDIFAPYFEKIISEPKEFQGKKIKLRGFVYREEGMGENQLIISRFLITHCIADASIIGLLTEFEEAKKLTEDTWLELEGTLDVTIYNGVEIPILRAQEWNVIEVPETPYIYPVLTKLL